jgi:hypothetical protein
MVFRLTSLVEDFATSELQNFKSLSIMYVKNLFTENRPLALTKTENGR